MVQKFGQLTIIDSLQPETHKQVGNQCGGYSECMGGLQGQPGWLSGCDGWYNTPLHRFEKWHAYTCLDSSQARAQYVLGKQSDNMYMVRNKQVIYL